MSETQLDPVLRSSTEEIVLELFGIEVEPEDDLCLQLLDCHGSRLPLTIDEQEYEVGFGSQSGCAQQLSKTLFGIDDPLEALDDEEVADALGELTNMIVGRFKGKLSTEGCAVQLATPQAIDQFNLPKNPLKFHNSEIQFFVFISEVQT